MTREIDGVVLAGGRSRRMGRDKALLPFGGYSTLAEYQYRRLLPLFPRVWLSAKENKFPFEAPLLPDRSATYSPLVALASILERIEGEAAFLLGVDMPFVPPRLVSAMLRGYEAERPSILAARGPRGPEPLCALYSRSLLPEIHRRIARDEHRLQALLEFQNARLFPWDNPEAFRNLNRPEEYREARSGWEPEGEK